MSETEKESVDLWQMIEQVLLKFDNRLKDIENRLSQIETKNQTLLNETQVPEEPRLLGGRTISLLPSGTLERTIRLPVCDICGRRLQEEFVVCHSCGKKLCEKCIVAFDNRNYCLECLRNILPLTKKSFKVLMAIANEITCIETISDLTRMSRAEVRECISELLQLQLIAKKGASVFSKIQATDNGMEAIGVFSRIYGEDQDTVQFEVELKEHSGGLRH
jgi:hypothetical protein